MCVRKKNFHVSCTWYKSLLGTPPTLCTVQCRQLNLLPRSYLFGLTKYIVANEKAIFMLLHHPRSSNNRLAFLAWLQGLMVVISSRSSASNAAFKMAFRYASTELIFPSLCQFLYIPLKLKIKEQISFLKIKTIILVKNAICATDKQQDWKGYAVLMTAWWLPDDCLMTAWWMPV